MKLKKISVFVSAVLATLVIGGIAGAYLIDHFHLSEMPNRFIEQEADGARVRFMYFEPMHMLGPNEKRTIVVVFYDWKNNTPIKQVVYRTHDSAGADRLFYSDENMISALVDDHVLFNYDKKTRTVTKKEFGSAYTLIKPSPDWQNILAWEFSDQGSSIVSLDGSGHVRMGTVIPSFIPENAIFFDHNQKVAIETEAQGGMPSDLYTWNLATSELTKETDMHILGALWQNGKLFADDNGAYIQLYLPSGEERIPLTSAGMGRSVTSTPRVVLPFRQQVQPGFRPPETGMAVLYGMIESIAPQKTGSEIAFRLIDWVHGQDSQEQAALEIGRCTLESIENNECLSNPFFVRPTDKRLALPIAKDVQIQIYARNGEDGMVANAEGNIYLTSISKTDFINLVGRDKIFKMIPFIFTTTNGVTTQIEEQYVP